MDKETYQCSKCGIWAGKHKLCIVDNAYFCTRCMYGDIEPVEIYPIGIVKNNLIKCPTGFGVVGDDKISKIILFPAQESFMYKLEDEKYITIIYYLHKSGPVKPVFNRGLDGKLVGVFASRTPNRLSKIAIQDVTLIKIEGTTLYVEGLDAINGSPVLDIKLKINSIKKEK
ncbi:MAG: SAM-dependent methyltransferase [Deltaproteobacteria bacterium]|nr:SAM-dependent methyltransferase [Deltaproteobacteria bacterium]